MDNYSRNRIHKTSEISVPLMTEQLGERIKLLYAFNFIGLIIIPFLPIMIMNAPSIGCRFSEGRLQALMVNYPADIFCVLHPVEILMFISGTIATIAASIMAIQQHYISIFTPVKLMMTTFALLLPPFVDLTLLGVLDGPFRHNITYTFSIGYYVYGFILAFIAYTIYLEYQKQDENIE